MVLFFFFVFFVIFFFFFFFFSSRRRHTRWTGDWSSDVCSSDLAGVREHDLANLRQLHQQRLAPAERRARHAPRSAAPPGGRAAADARLEQIGRASCRERGEISVVAGSVKEKKKRESGRR